jgi:hypothetical protein
MPPWPRISRFPNAVTSTNEEACPQETIMSKETIELFPTLLGAVAGTRNTNADVLTGSGCGCQVCDACSTYARTSQLQPPAPKQ